MKFHFTGLRNEKDCKHFDHVVEGKKTIEIRVNDGKYTKYNTNDILVFVNGKEKVYTKITDIKEYPSYDKIVKKENIEQIMACDLKKSEIEKRIYKIYPASYIRKINNKNKFLVFHFTKLTEKQKEKVFKRMNGGYKYPFDKVYLVNLDRAKDRLHDVTQEIKKVNLFDDLSRISAVDGMFEIYPDLGEQLKSTTNEEEKWDIIKEFNNRLKHIGIIDPETEFIFKPGQVGHYLTFYKLLRKIKKKKYEKALILEDDISFIDNFPEKLSQYINELPKDWEICYFGMTEFHHKVGGSSSKLKDNLCKPIPLNKPKNKRDGLIVGNHAQMFSHRSASKISKLMMPMKYPTDVFMGRLAKFGQIKVYSSCDVLIKPEHKTSYTETISETPSNL